MLFSPQSLLIYETLPPCSQRSFHLQETVLFSIQSQDGILMNTEAMGCVNSIKNPEQGVFNLWKKGQISQEGKDVRRFCRS